VDQPSDSSGLSQKDLARWFSGVHAFIAAVNKPASLRELLDLVTATACDLTGYEFCGILLVHPDKRRLMMEGAHGLSTEYVSRLNDQVPISLTTDPRGESPSTRAFLTAKAVVLNDILKDPLMEPWWPLAAQQGYLSMVSVPLLLKGRPFGVLNCYSAERHSFTESAVELMGILANQAAAAIEAIHLRDGQRDFIENLARVNESLRQQSALLQKSDEIHKSMNEVAIGAAGIDGLTETLSTLLNREVFIDDEFGQMISPLGARPALLPLSSAAEHLEAHGDMLHVQGDEDSTWILSPIRFAGEVIARLWINGQLHELSQLDRRAIENASVIAALEIIALRSARDIEWRLQGEVIDVLLNDHPSTFESLPGRASNLGHDLRKLQFVGVLHLGSECESTVKSAAHLARKAKAAAQAAVRNITPRPVIAVRDPHLIILIAESSSTNPQGEIERVRSSVAKAIGNPTLRAVVGSKAIELKDVGSTIRVERGAHSLMASRNGGALTVALEDLGVLGLLLQLDDPDRIAAFAQSRLAPLQNHDHLRSTALMETLRTFFAHHCNITATAKSLYLHPNSIKMRLRKIETLLRVSLSNPDDLLDLRTALLAEEVARS
jgi:sugar diacid utilization regulator